MARKAEDLGGSLTRVFDDPDSSGKKTAVLSRPEAKKMLEALQAGDTLIVNRLDRLGYSMRDVQKTAGTLYERGVRIHLLHALDGELNIAPPAGGVILQLCDLWARTEKSIRSERLTEAAQRRKESGLAYCNPPMGKKIVKRGGAKVLEWDMKQLGYIAEIAERLPRKVRRRSPRTFGGGGSRTGGAGCGVDRLQRIPDVWALNRLMGLSYTPYQQFYRAVRWFHR